MKRRVKMAGWVLLALGGGVVAMVIHPWPLVWLIGLPLMWAGAAGFIREEERDED